MSEQVGPDFAIEAQAVIDAPSSDIVGDAESFVGKYSGALSRAKKYTNRNIDRSSVPSTTVELIVKFAHTEEGEKLSKELSPLGLGGHIGTLDEMLNQISIPFHYVEQALKIIGLKADEVKQISEGARAILKR